jgi:hypothetical protein
MVAFHGSPSYRIAGILPALLLMDRWSPDRQSLSFLPATRQPMPPGWWRSMAFLLSDRWHPAGCLSYRIAGILPAVFLIGSLASCRQSFLSDRWHPAGNLSYRIAGILPALLLMDRWSPDQQSLSFLPATRQPMPPGMVAFHGFPLIGSLASCRLFF